MKNLVLAAFLTPMLLSCVSLPNDTKQNNITKIGEEVIITWPADQNHVYLKMIDGKRTICRSASPDFAVGNSKGISLSASAASSASEKLADTDSQTDVSLGGRNPSVLIVREVMYRSCEMALNVNASEEKIEAIFFKTLEALSDVFKAPTNVGGCEQSDSDDDNTSCSDSDDP